MAAEAIRAGPILDVVGFRLAQLGAETVRRFHERMRCHDLEPRHFGVLRTVGALEGPTQQEVGQLLRIPPSSLVTILDELEGRGALDRRPHPTDRRAHVLTLTPDGRRLLGQAMASALALEEELCADLGPEERAVLLGLLSRVAATLDLGQGVPHVGAPAGD